MDKAFVSLLKRSGITITALSDTMGVTRLTVYNWMKNSGASRPGDRVMIEVIRSAIKDCMKNGTLPLPPDATPAGGMTAAVKRRIYAEVPANLRGALKKK